MAGIMLKWKERLEKFLHNRELKRKLYVIIFQADTRAGRLFDLALIGFIIASVLMVILESMYLFSPRSYGVLRILEYVFTVFFTFEYVVRIYCSPKPRKYIFSFFGIVDLLATLPVYLSLFFHGAHYFLVIRAFRLIRIFRIFKLFSFINEGNLLLRSLRISAPKISVFFFFVLILVTSMGTIMYIFEGTQPNSQFDNIPNSIYWAIVTMTTVGYGDITPVTPIGRFLSAIIMLIGYTIIAVPTGIVSATMVSQQQKRRKRKCPHCHRSGHDEQARYCQYCGAKLPEETDEETGTDSGPEPQNARPDSE